MKTGEGRHTVHQLLYHLCQHVGAKRILASDPQRLVEVLHGIGEVPSQSLHVAQGGVGAGVQGGEYKSLLVEADGLLIPAQLPEGVAKVVQPLVLRSASSVLMICSFIISSIMLSASSL